MANNSNHITSRYGKWITNKQKERLRKLYKGYRQSTAGDMRSQYLNARKGMYGVRTTASAYGLGEGYVARKKAQMDSSLAEAGRQYAAQADAAFENNAVRPAANATIQAENERKQREYEEKLRKAREKAAKQAKAQADFESALEEYNRNKDKTDKENAKRLAEYKRAMAKYKKELKNAKQRGEKLDRLPQRQILHGGQPLPKGLSLSADLHQYEGATSTPKPLKPLPKGKGKGKGKGNGRGGLLSTDMYEYESGTGHQPIATSHQGLNNRPVAPKTNYAANQTAIQKRKKAKEAVVGKPTKPILAITDTPIPVAPYIEKDLVAKVEAVKPEEIPQLKTDYINSVVEHERLVGELYNEMKSDMNRIGLMQEFDHWVGVAQNTTLSPAERKQAAMYASRAAEEYNLQDNGKAHKERVATLMQMANDSHDQLVQQQYLLQQLGVRMSEDEIGFDTGYLRQYGAIPAQANDTAYAQAQALGDKNSDLGKQLRELTKMEYLHSQGLPSGQLSPQMQAFIEENNLGWLIDQDVLDRAPLVGIETAIEEKLKKGGDERTEYLQRKGIDRVQRELSTSDPEAIKRVIESGDSVTHLRELSQIDTSVANFQSMATGGGHQGKTSNEVIKELEKNLDLPSGYISFNTLEALKKDEASVAFIDYCYATGQADLAKQYIFDLTEAANKAAGKKQADKISNLLPDGWKWIPEFMYHLGYGASNAIWGKIDFFRGKTPTRTGAYTQEGIIQNEIKRGWSEGKARNWANALTSAGENFTDLAIGTLTKGALGAAGDAIGGTVGNIVGKVAGHAPGISMGWSAAGSAKQEMLKKGYNEKAATIYGIFSGVSEAVLQEQVGGLVGFGDRGAFTKALSGIVDQIPNAAGRTAINAVLDVASEIGQEEFGNILDSVYRSVVLGEGNDVYADFKEQFNETAVTTAISTLLLNALHIPTQIRNERGYSAIADASGMSLNDAKFLLETDAAINGGKRVDPNDILRYNELTANLMASMPDNVVKAIADGKMTVADWVTSNEGIVQGKLTGKLTEADTKTEAAKNPVTGAEIKAVDHTEALKGKTDEQRRDYLLTAAPTGKAGSAYYTTTNGKAIEFKNLDTTQKANYVLAQKCAKAFEGSVDVVIHDTLPLSNGAMVGKDGRLHIALDVTDKHGESIAYWTLAHEAGHALKIADSKVWGEMFDVLTNYAKNYKDRDGKILYDALVDSITNQYDYANDSDAFNDEMFSLIAENMVGSKSEQWAATLGDNTIFDAIAKDRNASAKAKRGFFGKMKNAVEKLSRQFRDGGFSKERKRLAKIREQLTEAYKRINEVPSIRDAAVARKVERKAHEEARKLREQTERREGFQEGLKAHDAEFNKQKEAREKKARDDALLEEILKGFEEEDKIKASEMTSNMSEDGEVIGDLEIDNDGNVNRFSIRTTPQTEEGWDSLVNDMVAAGYTEEQAKAWIDDMRSVAAEIMDAQEFLDYENDPRSSWFRKNAEYTQGTIDFSNNCPRRAEFTAQFDALMKQFPNFAFTAEDYETIRTIIKDAGIAVTCGGCYVEERRQHLSEIGQLFLDKYHAALNGETGDNALAKKFFDKISEEDRKYDITLDDIVSSDSLRKLYDEHPTLYRAFNNFNNARGMAAARLVYGLSEYNNQIKKWNKGTITRKNNLGGLRIFSYSDADPRIILDVMQIITDSASKGLMMQGYTKKPWFAVFMKDTGVRLLRSHIPMGTGYKMVKGQMVLDFDNFEGINTKDEYYSMLDRDTDLNIGNNVIGINDTQIRLAMVSDIIDQIIPFHTGLKKSILHQKKLEGWNNYREYQTDKAWTAGDNGEYKWRTVKKGGINLYTDIVNAIDWSKTETHADGSPMTDAERFVNKYLDICREKGFKPRFAQFLCDENGNELSDYGDDHFYIEQDGKKVANPDAWYTYNPGYEKFLVDFRLFDKNGRIIEQNAVAPNFDNEFVKSLFSEYIKENPQAKPMDKGVQTKIVDAMKKKYGDELNSTRHSLRATDTEYLSLAEKYRDGTASAEDINVLNKAVEEAAKANGYKKKVYHGTRGERFNIFDFSKDRGGNQQMFFSDNRKISETYGRNVMSLYINTDNFLTVDADGKWWNAIKDKRTYNDFYAKLKVLRDAYEEANAEFFDVLKNNAKAFTEGRTTDEIAAAEKKSNDALKAYQDFEGRSGEEIISGEAADIGNYAKEHGYAGTVIKNVVDTADEKVILPSTVYIIFDSNRVKSADPVTYDDNGDIIPLSERFNAGNEDIRYQKRIKAEDKRDAGEKLTESQFYSVYSAHKLDLRGKGNIEEQIKNIKEEGFKGYGGFGNNIMPTRQFTSYPTIDKYNALLELEKKGGLEPGYAEKYKAELGDDYGKPVPSNLSEKAYGPRKGEWVMLVPRSGVEHYARGAERVLPGYKPAFDYEFVQVDYDYQPYYEMYSKAYDRYAAQNDDTRHQQRDFRIDFNVPQLDTKALHEAVKGGEGTVENRFEVKYEKTDAGFAVHITDKDSGKTYDRAETVTEGNAKAEAERAAAAVIRNIKRGRADSTSKSTAGIYIEPGANAARSSAVPVSYEDENGNIRRNSKVARTMIEAGWMTDEQAERFADQVHDGIMSYEPVTNAEAKAYAEEKVSEHPAAAQAEWEAVYNSFAIPSDKDLAVGYQLMANAANDGDFDMMLKLGTELREMMTKAGQAIQSMNLLKQMGAVADVYRVDQAVQKMNDDLTKAAKGYFITVNPDLVEALLKTKPDTKEYDKALEALYKDIASQIKPSLSDALTEYRYLAMLGNPRTHIRNLVGNAVFMPAVAMKNVFGTILEGIRYGSNSAMKTKALTYGKQYGQFAKEDWGKVKTTIKSTGNKYRDMMSDIDNYRNHFGKGLGWLDKLAKFNGKLLEGEDMLFKQAYYRTALAAELSAKKVNLNDLRAAIEARDSGAKIQKDSAEFKLLSLYEEARARAIKEANINTYNDANKFARDLNAFSRGGGKLRHMMVEGLLPFKNTPANIVSRSIEYSPVGLINSVTREAVKLHKGQIGANEFFDKIARGFSGSAIFALGVWLAKAGVLVGPLGDDKEDKEKKRRGHQAFSVEIAGKSYTLDWMAPVCIPLFTGVALYEMLEKDGNGEHWSQYAMNALTGMLEPITKMSMLEGIENLIDSLAYSDSKLEDAAITVGTSYLTQFIPTFSGQIARTIDPYTRRTYSDKESMLPRLVDKFVQTVQKKIPGWNQSLQPYVNELGEAEKEDNLWLRIFDNFISPGFRSAISNTKLDKELERLGDPSIYPSAASKSFTYNKATYNLHADEYTAFATARGTTAGTLMNSLIDSKAYQGLTDLDQVKAQAKAIEYANAIAKAGILNMRGILDSNIDWDALGSWVPKANEYAKLSDSPTALADYIAIKTYTDGMKAEGGVVFGNIADYTYVDTNGENKVDWSEMKNDYLNSLGLSSDEVLYLADAFGIKDGVYQEAQTIIAETPGLTADAYTEALNKFRDLDLERDKAKGEMTDEEFKAWEAEHKKAFYDYLNTSKLTGQQKFALLKSIKGAGWDEKAATLADKNIDYDSAWDAIYYHSNLKSTDEASKSKQFYAYLAGKNKLTAEQKFAVISATVGSDYPNKVEELRKQGIGYDAAWNALYTAKTATSTDDAGVLAQVKQNIGKERGLNGKQRFALLGICGGKAVKEKADSFAKQYGMSYDTAWAAMLKYNDKTCHGAEYHSWVDQQSATAKQKFLMLEFTNGQSSWLEKADAFYKEGVKYETTWKIAHFAEKQSGRGKKDRIIAYAKSLGLSSKQAEAMYEKFGR